MAFPADPRRGDMTRIMREYDLYAPVRSNDGKRLPAASLKRIKKRLIGRFGGLTYFPQKNKGVWKLGQVVFRDEVVILRVLAPDTPAVRTFWRKLSRRLCSEWNQKAVLIVARRVNLV